MNGTIINYYFHCKRQCYMFAHRLNLEDNSEIVKIGKAIHEDRAINSENTEIKIENIALDKINSKYVTEVKKSDADVEASKWQLLYYLKILKDKGIERKGKLEFVEKNKRNLINSIERLYALIDLELIEKSVDAIDSAKKVYLFGVGASGIVCYDINYKLSRIGKNVVFNNDIHLQLVNLNFITTEDACVCVSYSGNTKETVLVAEIAKKAGAKTVGICCYGRNELSKICDITLRVPHDERELRLGAISSRNTTLTLLDTIYLAITHRHYPDVLNDIESTRDLIKKLRD